MLRLSADNLATPLMVRHGSNQSVRFRGMIFLLLLCTIHAGVQYFGNAYYGQGSGSIFLDNVACNGSEASLLSCAYSAPSSSDTHSEDVGVKCPGQQCLITRNMHAYKIKLHASTYSYSIISKSEDSTTNQYQSSHDR